MTEFDPRPPARAVLPAAAAAVVALAASVTSTAGLLMSGGGAVMTLFGAYHGTRRLAVTGGGILFVGVVAGGAYGAPVPLTLAGCAAAVVAADAAEHAVSVGYDVGHASRAGHAVLVHVASTTAVAMVVATTAYALYRFGPGSLPVTGLLAFVAAGVMLTYALRT